MIKEELKNTQAKLTLAIKQHQVILVKLRSDPKNEVILRELRSAQLEIYKWSELQKQQVCKLRVLVKSEQDENATGQKLSILKMQSVGKSKSSSILLQKQHPPRPSILQGRKSVLRLQNEVPVNIKAMPPEASDIRHLLTTSMQTQAMSVKEFQKVEYMASLNLVTRERLKELEGRRGERRRRSTAVPQFSYIHGHLYPEQRKRPSNDDLTGLERKKSRVALDDIKVKAVMAPPSQKLQIVEVSAVKCGVCQQTGDMNKCHLCQTSCHIDCFLVSIPPTCPSCQISREMAARKSEQAQRLAANSSSSPSLMHEQPQAYRAVLSDMQEDKEKLRDRLEETGRRLRVSAQSLEEEASLLGNIVEKKLQTRNELRQQKEETENRIQHLKNMMQQLKDS